MYTFLYGMHRGTLGLLRGQNNLIHYKSITPTIKNPVTQKWLVPPLYPNLVNTWLPPDKCRLFIIHGTDVWQGDKHMVAEYHSLWYLQTIKVNFLLRPKNSCDFLLVTYTCRLPAIMVVWQVTIAYSITTLYCDSQALPLYILQV